MIDLRSVEGLMSPQGWAYASSPPVEAGDPGRYHALFGRDSLIFALQVLPERPDVAVATLRALAEVQGQREDPEIDESPGKIIHEYRPVAPTWLVELGWPIRHGGIRYYGTSDATSWFLVLLAATNDAALQAELADARAAAARWLEEALRSGRGLIRCGPRRYPGGLGQHGWRDCLDPTTDDHGGGIVLEDGSMPAPPLADADSQAVAVAALRALITLDPERAGHWRAALDELRRRVSETFTPNVMAVDGSGTSVSGAGSQLGWLLWADALDAPSTTATAARLLEPDILTPFGLRTLSSRHPGFQVHGYHRGAIWPFDSWIGWGGLRAHGHSEAAERVRSGVLDAIQQLGRFPELYAVDDNGALDAVPVANRVQAWTVGAASAFASHWDGLPRD